MMLLCIPLAFFVNGGEIRLASRLHREGAPSSLRCVRWHPVPSEGGSRYAPAQMAFGRDHAGDLARVGGVHTDTPALELNAFHCLPQYDMILVLASVRELWQRLRWSPLCRRACACIPTVGRISGPRCEGTCGSFHAALGVLTYSKVLRQLVTGTRLMRTNSGNRRLRPHSSNEGCEDLYSGINTVLVLPYPCEMTISGRIRCIPSRLCHVLGWDVMLLQLIRPSYDPDATLMTSISTTVVML